MIQNFGFNLDKIKNISQEEKSERELSLSLFNKKGFPNKKLEDWKFTDFNKIIGENFKELHSNFILDNNKKFLPLKDFDHNSITLINGFLNDSDFKYEKEENIVVNKYLKKHTNKSEVKNALINLNDALFEGGYFLDVLSNYKFKKPLIIYNYFSNNLKNTIINNKNLINLGNHSTIEIIEYNMDLSEDNFITNNYTEILLGANASFKNYTIQGNKSNGFFYKFIKSSLSKNSSYEDYIFSSGLKFNKIEEEIDINGEGVNCNIQSGLFLDQDQQQEIKTQINHLQPNSKSYQKVKNVLNKNCKSAYQGKIFVEKIAQKTDAYQLSKALILNDLSEFNAKPELEIYADDVKCSHGSTSGNMNEDSIYYLMTRGVSRKQAIEILTEAFLFEITDSIKSTFIKNFIESKLTKQIYGH